MKNPTRHARALAALAIGLFVVVATACSPEDMATYMNITAQARAGIDAASRLPGAPSDATLARLRNCESHGNYHAISRSGTYRGAYQFNQSTWNNVARSVLPNWVGADPASAPDYIQDAHARALWSMSGSHSWPVCGRNA